MASTEKMHSKLVVFVGWLVFLAISVSISISFSFRALSTCAESADSNAATVKYALLSTATAATTATAPDSTAADNESLRVAFELLQQRFDALRTEKKAMEVTAPAAKTAEKQAMEVTAPAMPTTSAPAEPAHSRQNITIVCGPLYGDSINYVAIVGWLKYYEERWGLTHAELYIQQDIFESVQTNILQAKQERTPSLAVIMNFHPLNSYGKVKEFHAVFINTALYAAQLHNSSYFLNFDADEFLVSKQFKTLDDMFAAPAVGNKPAISFPIFGNNYHFCETKRPTFDSMTYHNIAPIRTEKLSNDSQMMYAEPARSTSGNQKYIVRPSEVPFIKGVHSVGMFDEVVAFMTGRTLDHQDARVMHYRGGVGIHADTSSVACALVPPRINNGTTPCQGFLRNGNVCKDNFMEGDCMHEPTEVNSILAGYPISAQAEHFYNEAVCYAERYPDLKQVYCMYDDTRFCHAEELWKHYNETSPTEKRIFGCQQDSAKR
jgi:Glycosyltransferase family 92